MYKKIAVAGIRQETCSFNSIKTELQNFRNCQLTYDSEVVNVGPEDGVMGGFCSIMKAKEISLQGIVSAKSTSGGELSAETFTYLKDTLLTGIKKAKDMDAVFLTLHGAMAAENELDTEGLIISEVRKLVGKDCFIGVTLDHHANVTPKMLEFADVMVGYETQPHELSASGIKTARVMLDMWKNNRAVYAALVKVPMLAPQDNFLTSYGPMKEWFDLARKIEKDPTVIVASTFPTQPWLDVPNNGWSCLVYADTQDTAQAYAEQLAQKAWDLRGNFWHSERLSLKETIATANRQNQGVVIISDTGDAVAAGAPGDSMSLVAEMLKQDLRGPALVPVVDSKAYEQALQAGIGQTVTLNIGSRMNTGVSITGIVKAIAKAGKIEFKGWQTVQVGGSILFEHGNLKIAILEYRDYSLFHPSLYQRLGLDVAKAQMAILKTGSQFQHFKDYQSCLLRADSPGASQSNLTDFDWKYRSHPMYPFEKLENWRSVK